MTERIFKIAADVDIEVRATSKKEAVEKAKNALQFLDIISFRVLPQKRTLPQNSALHLLFTQLSKECLDKGIEMRDLVKEEIPIEATPENIKWLWKLLQNALFKTKSTTELKKTGQIEIVYDAFNKILIERTNGEISLPDWPSLETQTKETKLDYPELVEEPTF
mgnify:CR=1 FL=1